MHGRHLPSAVRAPVGAAGDVHAELLQDLHDDDRQRYAQPDDLIVVLLVAVGDGDLAEAAAADRAGHGGVAEDGHGGDDAAGDERGLGLRDDDLPDDAQRGRAHGQRGLDDAGVHFLGGGLDHARHIRRGGDDQCDDDRAVAGRGAEQQLRRRDHGNHENNCRDGAEEVYTQKLPEGFQRAEFLVEHGFVDKIVKREELKETLAMILKLHKKPESGCLADWKTENTVDRAAFEEKEQNSSAKRAHHGSGKAAGAIRSAWDSVLLSRKADRPVATDYIRAIFDDFMEFHGDRYCKDDGAIVGGIASFHGMPVTVIGQEKGKNTKDNIKRNFGMPSPDGYRKALRLMKQAETFGRPVVCFVDTPGAFCGLEAEERGQGEAIARNLFEMSDLTVPVLSIVIGEGGSGGALAMAVANEVWMMENAVYSVLSPEGFASILWKDSKRADEAARVMKMTAAELKELGIIERVIPEPEPASIETMPELAEHMRQSMTAFFERYSGKTKEAIRESRYQRFRNM